MKENERQAIIENITKKYSVSDDCPFLEKEFLSYKDIKESDRGVKDCCGRVRCAENADSRDRHFMRCAMELAAAAADFGEVPVGAVIVRGNRIISADFNGREMFRDALYHAELSAIRTACRVLGGWRLVDCELYVTLEPCPMCAGAVINARVPRTIIGAADPNFGAFGSVVDLNGIPGGYKTTLEKNVLGEECARLLKDFFSRKRKKKTAFR